MATDPTNILIGSGVAYLSESTTSDTVSSSSSTVITATTGGWADDAKNGSLVEITSGSGKGQFRHIWDSAGTAKTLSVEPDLTTTPSASDTIAIWDFTALDGGFKDDLAVAFSEDRYNVEIADALVYVKGVRTRIDITVGFSLVEATLANLRKALGLPSANLAAGGSTNNVLFLTDEESGDVALKFVGSNNDGELKTWFFPKCRLAVDLSMTYSKGGEVLIPVAAQVYGWLDGTNYGFGFCIDA